METGPVAGAVVSFYSGTPNIGTYITDALKNGKPVNARKLTPTECERLQGFPDDWTSYGIQEGEVIEISDHQRYKMLGNAVSVPVVQAVAVRLKGASKTFPSQSSIPISYDMGVQDSQVININNSLQMKAIEGSQPGRSTPLEAELKVIKRYLDLHNQVKSPAAIYSFISNLHKTIARKLVRKTSPLASEINLIQDKLIKAYSRMKGTERIVINDKDLFRLSGIVQGKVDAGCSCDQEIGRICGGRKKGTRRCLKGSFSDARGKGTCSHNYGLGVLTAEQIANRKFEKLAFVEPWRSLIGTPAKNFTLMLHGEPGAGKTSFLLKFAEYLAINFGKVIYISSEEFEATTITDMVNELLNPFPPNLEFFVTLKDLDLSGYDFVILDSVNDLKLKLDEFKNLRKAFPDKAFILVLQHTKDGAYRGGKDWEHEIQIAGEVKTGAITIYRSRYGVKGMLDFFSYFNIKPGSAQ